MGSTGTEVSPVVSTAGSGNKETKVKANVDPDPVGNSMP